MLSLPLRAKGKMAKIHNWKDSKEVERLGSLIFKDITKNCSKLYNSYNDDVSEETDLSGTDGYLVSDKETVPVQLKVELYPNCFIETYQESHKGKDDWSKKGWALDNNLKDGAKKAIFWINPLGILAGRALGFLLEASMLNGYAESNKLSIVKNREYWSEGIPVRYDRMPIWFTSVKQQFLWSEIRDKLDDKSLLDEFLKQRKDVKDWNPIDNPLNRKIA